MRLLNVSATTILPSGPIATLQGRLNCPGPEPGLPSGLPIANWKATPWAHAGPVPTARLASKKILQIPRVIMLSSSGLTRRVGLRDGRCTPEPHGTIGARRGEGVAVGGESHGRDQPRVTGESGDHLPDGRVPDPDL